MFSNSIEVQGVSYSLESGKWAKQANGSVILRWGKLMLMANATAAKKAMEGVDFFPLTVDYREKFYASGHIPGGFFKREGRPTDKEVLTSRLTDRPLRPLFPSTYFNEVQIFVTLLSSNGKQSGDVHSITAASAALIISDIPFHEPVAGVRVSRVDGNFILFPTLEQQAKADLNLALAGSAQAVTMIEGSAQEVSEEDMLAAVKVGHQEIQRLCALQLDLQKQVGKEKAEVPPAADLSAMKGRVRALAFEKVKEANSGTDKKTRQDNINAVAEETLQTIQKELAEQGKSAEEIQTSVKQSKALLEEMEVEVVRDQIFHQGIRADRRKLNEVRPISIEVGVLPGAHGSAVFTRGETQSLGVVTLGTGNDAQSVDDIEGESKKNFYLHYNFPPFSVGEVRRYGGPGRREIGHGKLAENAISAVIPAQEKFPYVIRVVSEILESNGSSSMATVCSASLSLMDAGVPIPKSVAGIAMGLITNGEQFAVLSDIAGLEDHFGDMDFKVAGSKDGITAFQMDLKINGISYEIMEKALAQAKEGRMHILGIMEQSIQHSREDLSPNAPRITTLQIDKERIGELIGPGGKNIRSIIEKTGVDINVNDEGIVTIASSDQAAAQAAEDLINGQFAEPELNAIYDGVVKKIADFGAFIEILPGREGLCHISKLSHRRVNHVRDVLSEGDKVRVKLIAIDSRQGKLSLSLKDVDE